MSAADAQAQQSSDPANPSHSRLRSLLPSYYLVIPDRSEHVRPMTSGEKFRLAAIKSFDPISFLYAGAYAGWAQSQNPSPSWGQGGEGYAKRFGAAFADRAIDSYLTVAAFPVLFHEDPRYFRLGHGSFFRRAGYAISRIVVTRTDSGQDRINLSELFGTAAGAGIGVAYYPAENRTAEDTLQRLGGQIGTDAFFNVVKEFWPDIRHHRSHGSGSVKTSTTAPAGH